jgi:hypothetical protein
LHQTSLVRICGYQLQQDHIAGGTCCTRSVTSKELASDLFKRMDRGHLRNLKVFCRHTLL